MHGDAWGRIFYIIKQIGINSKLKLLRTMNMHNNYKKTKRNVGFINICPLKKRTNI